MIDKGDGILDAGHCDDPGRPAPLDHDNREMPLARGGDLGIGRTAPRILRNDHIDQILFEQLSFVGYMKRRTRQNVLAMRYVQRRLHRIDAADEVDMLRGCGEAASVLPADREKHPPRRRSEGRYGGLNAIHADPAVSTDSLPWQAAERKQRHTDAGGGLRRVFGNPAGEGMGRIDQHLDAFLSQIIDEAVDAAEAANPRGQRQWFRIAGPACERNRRDDVVAFCQLFGQPARLGRAAEDQDAEGMRMLAHG